MSSEEKQKKKSIFADMGQKKCLALMKRLDDGEAQKDLAVELGVTPQYISLEYQSYLNNGDQYRLRRHKGPTARLNEEQIAIFRELVSTGKTPSGELWDPVLAREAMHEKIGFRPLKSEIRNCLRDWRVWSEYGEDGDVFPQDYYAYIQSPVYKKIQQREEAMAAKWKREQEEQEEQQRKKSGQTSAAAPAGKIAKKTPVAELEPEWEFDENLSHEDYLKAIATVNRLPLPKRAHGVRVGKHRKGSNRQKSKKRRKK